MSLNKSLIQCMKTLSLSVRRPLSKIQSLTKTLEQNPISDNKTYVAALLLEKNPCL